MEDKKIIIDLNAEEMVNFQCKLGVSDCFNLLECLNQITGQISKHLEKITMLSYIKIASKIKLECELNQDDDGEVKITNEKLTKIIDEAMNDR